MFVPSLLVRRNPSVIFIWLAVLFCHGCDGNQATRADSSPLWQEFSGPKALEHVRQLVDLGPRPSGSDAINKSRDYITSQLRQLGWIVSRQTFADETPRGKVEFVNLV